MNRTTLAVLSLGHSKKTSRKRLFSIILMLAASCLLSELLVAMSQDNHETSMALSPVVVREGIGGSDLVKVIKALDAFKSAGKKKSEDIILLARNNAKFIMDVGTSAACVLILVCAYHGIVAVGDLKNGTYDLIAAVKHSYPVSFTQWLLGLSSLDSYSVVDLPKNVKLVCENAAFYQALVEQFGSEQAVLELFKNFPKYFVPHGCKVVEVAPAGFFSFFTQYLGYGK